jgi:hypothetical protein
MRFTLLSFTGSIACLAAAVSSGPTHHIFASTETIPPAVVNGSSNAIFTSTSDGLDGPKITPVNSTSWDWWYFDVVSGDAQSSAVIVFYAAPETGFAPAQAPPQHILQVSFSLNILGYEEPTTIDSFAESVTVTTIGNGASGEWTGTGFSCRF